MRFLVVATTLVAAATAQYSAEEACGPVVTVTVTETVKHTPTARSSYAPTAPAPYPTTGYQSMPAVPSGTGYPVVPGASTMGTGYLGAPAPSAKPSGTGASSAPYPQFTGAASSLKLGGVVASVGALAALFL